MDRRWNKNTVSLLSSVTIIIIIIIKYGMNVSSMTLSLVVTLTRVTNERVV